MKLSKKLLILPAVLGLVIVPSLAAAQHGADDNSPNDVRREDRREDRRQDRREDRRTSPATSSTNSNSSAAPRVDDNPSASDIAEGSVVAGASTSSSSNSTSSSSSSNASATPVSGTITVEQAKQIALSQYDKSTIRKTEVEIEHGVKMISVRFADGSRIDVSTVDGTVTRTDLAGTTTTTPRDDDNDDDDRRGRGGHGRDHSEDD